MIDCIRLNANYQLPAGSEKTFYTNLNESLLHQDKVAVDVFWFSNLSLKLGLCKPLDPVKMADICNKYHIL